jgi:uncharacterized protein YidB (DUF937 family)/outer membrane protein OmpA-like peptidoglycan-associated protein
MFDVLIREAAARFGLGDKALPLAQMLLAYMTNRDTGGLAGFLEKFKVAGLGPIIQSWLGGGPSAQPVSNSQLETVLGASGGLLSMVTSRLGVNRDNATSAIGYLLPAIVGRLTPGGSIPAALPAEISSFAAAGQSLLAAPAAAAAAAPAAASGGSMKWLPWLIVAAAALFGLSYCNKNRTATETAPATPPAATAPASEAAPTAPPPPATFGGAPAQDASAPTSQPAATAAPAAAEEPTGSAVVTWMAENIPALKVYFDSGKTDVHADFAAKSAELVSYMKANSDVKAVISGFNDPTGNAAANAELSKNRAQAVQAALVAQGIAQDRTVLEKPAETSGTGATNAASRRVEVVLRK